jgi:hypothetical protein
MQRSLDPIGVGAETGQAKVSWGHGSTTEAREHWTCVALWSNEHMSRRYLLGSQIIVDDK